MTIQDFFNKTYPSEKQGIYYDYFIRPRIICNDGFSMSVQANEGAYCSPRYTGKIIYNSAEIGFPSEEEPLINYYAEDKDYTQTVYGYVPIDVIQEIIVKHGGINEDKTFNKSK